MTYFKKLGRLPDDNINFFKTEILKRKNNKPFQWIKFDDFLYSEFLKIFENQDLKIQFFQGRPVLKAFYSENGYGSFIHKDGLRCQSALNIAISCNNTDIVRWYDDEIIYNIPHKFNEVTSSNFGYSRDTNIKEFEDIPHLDAIHTKIGDVYILDVNTYHTFKCVGNLPRIIIQAKFEGFPTLNQITPLLTSVSFKNLIKY